MFRRQLWKQQQAGLVLTDEDIGIDRSTQDELFGIANILTAHIRGTDSSHVTLSGEQLVWLDEDGAVVDQPVECSRPATVVVPTRQRTEKSVSVLSSKIEESSFADPETSLPMDCESALRKLCQSLGRATEDVASEILDCEGDDAEMDKWLSRMDEVVDWKYRV